MKRMKKRLLKKKAKIFMENFTAVKIPLAFRSESQRRQYVSAWARAYVGQKHRYPEMEEE